MDRPLLCQLAVLRHQQPEGFLLRELPVVILFLLHRAQQKPQIRQPAVQTFQNHVRVSALNVQLHVGVEAVKFCKPFGERVHGGGLRAADGDIPAQGPAVRVEGGFRGVDQLQDLLRPLFQIDAFLRQRDPALPADKQLPAQLGFQIYHLLGQRGLGQKQGLCRLRDILLPGNCEKIVEKPCLDHMKPPVLCTHFFVLRERSMNRQ